MAFHWKMARNAFPCCRGWRLEKDEWKGAAERAEILGEGKELKDTVDSEPSVASENEMYSSVVRYCLPGTSTFPMNGNSLDFQVLAQAQQACSAALSESCVLGFRRRRWPSWGPPLIAGSPNPSPYRTGLPVPCHSQATLPSGWHRSLALSGKTAWCSVKKEHANFQWTENTFWGRRK